MTYAYDESGERTKTTPEKGPATTYGYDQAGNLTSVERPKEGETTEIKDTYAYNGEGLRTSQTISGTTSYLAWDMTEELPLILTDGTNSYIYGPGDLPIEQISSGGTVSYLHHDQQGSTRLLTGRRGQSQANAPTARTDPDMRRHHDNPPGLSTGNTPAATRASSTCGHASTTRPQRSS